MILFLIKRNNHLMTLSTKLYMNSINLIKLNLVFFLLIIKIALQHIAAFPQ